MKKGSYGYLEKARKVSLIKSGLFLAAVLIVYFGALFYFKTNKNVFSILAAVGALPTGRSIVLSIMYLRAGSASARAYEAIEKACSLPEGCSGYDLYLTGYEHSFSVSHLAVLNRTVVGLAEDNSMDIRLCEAHIRDMVRKDEHVGYDVHIYRNLDEYIRTLQDLSSAKESMEESMEGSMEGSMEESMEGSMKQSSKDSAGTPSGSSHASSAEDRAVMKMILGISI